MDILSKNRINLNQIRKNQNPTQNQLVFEAIKINLATKNKYIVNPLEFGKGRVRLKAGNSNQCRTQLEIREIQDVGELVWVWFPVAGCASCRESRFTFGVNNFIWWRDKVHSHLYENKIIYKKWGGVFNCKIKEILYVCTCNKN